MSDTRVLRHGRQECRPSYRGLTLVEILTALFVLAIGLGSVLAIVVRSADLGSFASDRNCAMMLVSEAIDDIQHMVLIGDKEIKTNGHADWEPMRGQLMDTVGLGTASNMYNDIRFNDVMLNNTQLASTPAGTTFALRDLAYRNTWVKSQAQGTPQLTTTPSNQTNLAYWPFSTKFSRTMGMFPTSAVLNGSSGTKGDSMYNNSGVGYRALWKLEPHPEWISIDPTTLQRAEHPDSSYVGVYVLTVTMYRDVDPGLRTTNIKKRLQQISDPLIMQVRDKVVRK